MFGKSVEDQIDEQIYNLKYMAKSLFRTANQQKAQEKQFHKKAKTSLKNGDERTARAFLNQSRQFSNLALKSTNIACNLQIIEARIKESVQTGRISEDIMKTVSLLTSQLKPYAAIDMNGAMEKSFDDILVLTNSVANTMDGIASHTAGVDTETDNMLNGLKEEIANEAVSDLTSLPSLTEKLKQKSLTNYF